MTIPEYKTDKRRLLNPDAYRPGPLLVALVIVAAFLGLVIVAVSS